MAVRDIVLYPDDVLTTPTEEVEEVDDEIRQLVQDLADTMYDAPGVGLAAPQIGVLKRVCVIDVSGPEEQNDLKVLINPEIVSKSGDITWEEGCLSFPQLYEKIDRAHDVVVRALDEEGEEYEIEASELLAVAMQHEIDHLDGVLFIDHMSHLKRRRALKRYRKTLEQLERQKQEQAEPAQ
jgi:peptide deformylase